MFGCGLLSDIKALGAGIARTIFCILCAGPILMIVGGVFLSASGTDDRAAKIEAVNAATAVWMKPFGELSHFAYPARAYTVRTNQMGSTPVALIQSNTTDAPPLSPDASLKAFQPSRYTAVGSANQPIVSTNLATSVDFIVSIAGSTVFTSSAASSFSRTTSGSCKTTDTTATCQSRCSDGTVSGTNCIRYYQLTSVCFVVDPITNLLDTAGSGCSILPDVLSGSAAAGANIGFDGRVGPFGYAPSSANPTLQTNIPITVRSKFDPFVVALRLTGGSMGWGLTVEQKANIGVALLLIGVLLTILPICTACLLVKYCKRSTEGKGGPASSYPGGSGQVAVMTMGNGVPVGGGGAPHMQQYGQPMPMQGGGYPMGMPMSPQQQQMPVAGYNPYAPQPGAYPPPMMPMQQPQQQGGVMYGMQPPPQQLMYGQGGPQYGQPMQQQQQGGYPMQQQQGGYPMQQQYGGGGVYPPKSF